MTIFGNILTKKEVEDSVLEHLQLWLPTYLAEIERQKNLGTDFIAPPVYWSTTFQQGFDFMGEQKTPAILVMSPGINGKPAREGDGTMRAGFTVGIGAVVSAREQDETNALATYYAAAIRALMVQKVPAAMSDGAVWHGSTWEDEGYDDLPGADSRSLASCRLLFTLDFRGVVTTLAGPASPDPLDPSSTPWPEGLTVRDPDSAPPYTAVPPTTRSH